MDKLLEFLQKYRHWFVFILLEAIALGTLLNGTLYSRSLGWYATSTIFGRVGELMTEAWSYIDLRCRMRRHMVASRTCMLPTASL